MNRIYKVVYSKAKNCYVVTSEFAKKQTKSSSGSRLKMALLRTSLALMLMLGGVTGVEAAIGSTLVVNTSGNTTSVLTGDNQDAASLGQTVNNAGGLTRSGTTTTIEGNVQVTNTGNVTVGGDLTVSGAFKPEALSIKQDVNNYTTVDGGRIDSRNLHTDPNAINQTSALVFNENEFSVAVSPGGTPVNGSQYVMQGYSIDSSVTRGTNHAAAKMDQTSITNTVGNGMMTTEIGQTAQDITSKAANGTIAHDAKNILHKAGENIIDKADKTTITTTSDGTTLAHSDSAPFSEDADAAAVTTIKGNMVKTGRLTSDELEVSDANGANWASMKVNSGDGIVSEASDGTNTGRSMVSPRQVMGGIVDVSNNYVYASQNLENGVANATEGLKDASGSNIVVKKATVTRSTIEDNAGNKNILRQDAAQTQSTVTNGTSSTEMKQTAKNITSSAADGTISHSAKNLENAACREYK